MSHKKINLTALLLGLVIITQAQQVTNATGGNASGSGGSVAYSVGQAVYTAYIGSNGSIAQGVQQAYEISSISGVEDYQINLSMHAYPNPTTDYLTLKVESKNLQDITYQLFDLNGKLIESEKISHATETICVENLPSATYVLKVNKNNKEIKTFKIIKN